MIVQRGTGDWHRAVHIWLYVIDTHELLLQQRSEFKESWASLWDISVAGHSTFLHSVTRRDMADPGTDELVRRRWESMSMCLECTNLY